MSSESKQNIVQISLQFRSLMNDVIKGPGKRGHIVADTNVPLFARAQHCCGHKFYVRNKCFPVCAAQETSWATMCPQQCVLVYQGLKGDSAKLRRCVKYDASLCCGSVQSYNGKVRQVPSPCWFFFGWIDLANVALLQILSDVFRVGCCDLWILQ